MTFSELVKYANEKMVQYPDLKFDIIGFVDLAEMEIEDGGSETHECELALEDIKQLINE